MSQSEVKENFSIFYIEDSKFDFQFYKTIIEDALSGSYNISIDNSKSLFQATSAIQKNKYDIIILDLNLIDSKGYETFSTIKNSITNECPVLVITGIEDINIENKCLEEGAEGFFIKGVHERNLIEKIMSLAFTQNKLSYNIGDFKFANETQH